MTTTTIIIIAVCALLILITLPMLIKKLSAKKHHDDDADGDSEQIYVGNLPYRATERDLRAFFDRFGEIRNIRVIRDQHSGRSRGFAFVTYDDNQHAQKALEAHGEDLQGRQMVVRIAKAR